MFYAEIRKYDEGLVSSGHLSGEENCARSTAERLRSASRLLLGTLKYSWYKYCKALCLIKVLVFINEVTEGSIDQPFCFMSWRSPLSLCLALCSTLFHWTSLSLIEILNGSHTSVFSRDVLASSCVNCLLVEKFLSLSRSRSFHVPVVLRLFSLGCSGSCTGLVLISQPVWGGVGSSRGPLNIRVKWQNKTQWTGWACCSVSSFDHSNDESNQSWTLTLTRWNSSQTQQRETARIFPPNVPLLVPWNTVERKALNNERVWRRAFRGLDTSCQCFSTMQSTAGTPW